MKLLSVFALLALWPGFLQAGTFELSDPANEMYADQQAREQELAQESADLADEPTGGHSAEVLFCAVDSETDLCVCIDRVTIDVVEVSDAECRALAAGTLPVP